MSVLKSKKELLDKSGNSEDKGVNGFPSQIHPGVNAMQNKKWIILGTTVFLAAMFLCIATAAADALSGTWKMNPAKSKYSPGPAPKSLTVVIKSDENEYTVEANGVDAEGKPTHVAYSAKFDGKDYPATGIPNADTVSVKRIDASTVQTTQKKGGQLIMTVTTKVSKDGKTRTSTFVGKDAEGHDVHNVVEFEKTY